MKAPVKKVSMGNAATDEEHTMSTPHTKEAWAQSLSSVGLIAALIFGFSVSTFTEALGDVETELDAIFCVLMAIVSTSSGIATCTLALHFYYVMRNLDLNPGAVQRFLNPTDKVRDILGQKLTWFSFIMYLVALMLPAFEKIGRVSFACAIIAMVAFAIGAIAIVAVVVHTYLYNKWAEADLEKRMTDRETEQASSRC